MKDDTCIFCKLAAGEIPSATIYEDQEFRVLLDLNPATRGHALILPKEHFMNIFEMPEEWAAKAFALAKRLIIRGGTVKIIHKGEERTAATPETLDRMREWLAFREYAETEEPFTDTLPADATVIFSGNGQIAV